jgi:hypothetical protein
MCFIRIDEINQFHWILSTGETLFSWSIQLSNSFAIKQACLKVKKSCRLFFRDMQNYTSFKKSTFRKRSLVADHTKPQQR